MKLFSQDGGLTAACGGVKVGKTNAIEPIRPVNLEIDSRAEVESVRLPVGIHPTGSVSEQLDSVGMFVTIFLRGVLNEAQTNWISGVDEVGIV
ncbi:hypothetical protein HDE_05990 [Halotydeus destructor]|nr:hypothetical protein HDE_05990 [Halotydeus destructor]